MPFNVLHQKMPRGATRCRWAVATISLEPPGWLDAEASPWTCVRDDIPRVLTTTEVCAVCRRTEPRSSRCQPCEH